MLLGSDGTYLTDLNFVSQDDEWQGSKGKEQRLPVFAETCRWLDIFFGGREPGFVPPYQVKNATPFRQVVLNIVANIPYGRVTTYGEIAREAARRLDKPRMSAQAVGGAVGWNPICLIIPCHRVIGAKGTLTGYGGGMMNKLALLRLEGHRGTEKGISSCVTD
ncbi:MAG: methylated-DNA--[Selenomonas sp.]|nr:methylated-DNA--[protein]-cysteine S-methyltransferase [Selenomonas sp.]